MPTLATTDRVALGYLAETVFGTTPGSGTAKNIRFTGESFTYDLTKDASKEIRADRQTPGTTTVDANASGSLDFELSYAEYEPFLQAALFSTTAAFGTNGVGSTFTADFAATTITASIATSGANDLSTLQKGQWFRLTAPSHANDNKVLRVSTATAPTTTVVTLDASTTIATGTGVTNCKVSAARLTNGTTEQFFSIEKQLLDVTQFLLFTGQHVNKMTLKYAAGALTTGVFEFMGKAMTRAAVTGMPSALSASQTYEIQNGVANMGQIWEGTAPLTSTFLKSVDLTIENNLRRQTALGTLGAVGIGTGALKVTGTASAYFADGTLLDKFLADTYSGFVFGSEDASKNGYVITLPRVMQTGHKIVAGSKNNDVMAEITFEAYSDDTNAVAALRKTLFIDRVGAAVT